MADLPVSLTALYDKVNRVEPNVVQALVRGSAERARAGYESLASGRCAVAAWLGVCASSTGNHLPREREAPGAIARASAVPRYPDTRSSSSTPMRVWCSTW